MKKDWRLVNQHKYLQGKQLKKADFQTTPNCDHKHCAFCWDKFGCADGMLHSGFCTKDKYHWICETCFLDFKDEFEWVVEQ
jgi:hypothetical protein